MTSLEHDGAWVAVGDGNRRTGTPARWSSLRRTGVPGAPAVSTTTTRLAFGIRVFNEDLAAMIIGASYNILVLAPEDNVFVQIPLAIGPRSTVPGSTAIQMPSSSSRRIGTPGGSAEHITTTISACGTREPTGPSSTKIWRPCR